MSSAYTCLPHYEFAIQPFKCSAVRFTYVQLHMCTWAPLPSRFLVLSSLEKSVPIFCLKIFTVLQREQQYTDP